METTESRSSASGALGQEGFLQDARLNLALEREQGGGGKDPEGRRWGHEGSWRGQSARGGLWGGDEME